MERFAFAGVTLLFLLFGGAVAARDSYGCDSTMRGAADNHLAASGCSHSVRHSTGGITAEVCDSPQMASQLSKLCDVGKDSPGAPCCAAIMTTVEKDGCLCSVAEEPEFILADMWVPNIWKWYQNCGGRRRSVPQDRKSCKPGSAPPPSPPPPPPAKPEDPEKWPLKLWLVVGMLFGAAIFAMICAFLKLWLWLQKRVHAPEPSVENVVQEGELSLQVHLDKDLVNATTAAPSGSGEEVAPNPPVSPLRAEQSWKLARPRLPPAVPFQPLPLGPEAVQKLPVPQLV